MDDLRNRGLLNIPTKCCKISVREMFVETLSKSFKIRFSDLSRNTNIKNKKINCTKRNPRNPFLEWSSISWNSSLSKSLVVFHPFQGRFYCTCRDHHVFEPPPVYSDHPTLRPAQLGGFEKSRWPCSVGEVVSIGTNEKWILTLESCNICVLAGSDGIIPLRIWGLKNNTVQDVAEFGILSPKSV